MEVQVQSIHFDADVKLIEFIEKKVSKLTTFYDRIVGADVYLKVTKKEAKNNKTVEIKLSVPGAVLFATEQEDSFEAATDAAVEALKTQIKKHKGEASNFSFTLKKGASAPFFMPIIEILQPLTHIVS